MSLVGKHFAPPILGLGLLLAACHPTGAEYITDLDVVMTTHDATFDFAAANTYALPDKVVVVGDPSGGTPNPIDPALEQMILATLENEMTASGYQKVDGSASPDLTMTAAALQVTNVSYYYGSWCGYWAYYYPCYPYYPPVVGVSTYTTGTLIVDMARVNTAGGQYDRLWTAIIRGIQTGSKSTDQQRVVNGISQAFIQSPYLGKP